LQGGWITSSDVDVNLYRPSSIRDFQLSDELADEEMSGQDGGLRRLPAVAYTRAWSKDKSVPSEPTRYPGGFSIVDSSRGIIQFDEPQFRLANLGLPFPFNLSFGVIPATVWFETSFHCGKDGRMHRTSFTGQIQLTPVTPGRVVVRPEILYRVTTRYDKDGAKLDREDNYNEVRERLELWHSYTIGEYGPLDGGTVTYDGLMPIKLDGLMQQVTWSASNTTAATTTASQAQRHNRYIPGLEKQRDDLYIKRLQATLDGVLKDIKPTTLPAQWTGVVV
jgi:hypothetical protein